MLGQATAFSVKEILVTSAPCGMASKHDESENLADKIGEDCSKSSDDSIGESGAAVTAVTKVS